MLAYRMYNVITDKSFRVRPLKVTYIDSATGKSDDTHFAFLIEDDSDVAKRNDLKKLNIPKVKLSQLSPDIISDFSLFQLQIGNVDWEQKSALVSSPPAKARRPCPKVPHRGPAAWPFSDIEPCLWRVAQHVKHDSHQPRVGVPSDPF